MIVLSGMEFAMKALAIFLLTLSVAQPLFIPFIQNIENTCSCLDLKLNQDSKMATAPSHWNWGTWEFKKNVIFVEPTTITDVSLQECQKLCAQGPLSCKVLNSFF